MLITIELSLVDTATDPMFNGSTAYDESMVERLLTNVSVTTFNTSYLWPNT